jgi:hypothetical protein
MLCSHCGARKFGLIRHRMLTFSGYLCFCSALCKAAYVERVKHETEKKKRFQKWLYNEPSTS